MENQLNEAFTLWKNAQLDDSNMAVIYFTHRFALDFKNAKLSKALLEDSPRLILEKFQFKKIKGKAIECLKRWHDGEWNLVLSEKIFTPFEVLDYQVQGIRPVTMKMNRFEDPILHRKSSLDFFVHDLEHGYMFFHDENLKNMQIRFFKDIKESLDRGEWNERLKDADFREKFHYLISDMNTHEEHYRAYLQAII
ncbi:MAG: hypothetical protein EP319_00435 [Deltaproteobacteria bacterium]|nr:MAG: hypothetical protein EP319_00435 [Deltaproteobacteria bacterium]